MLAIYLLALAFSAGLTGLFAYQVLVEQGFVPILSAGIYLVAGVAFLYITIQTLYMLLVRVYKPTRDRSFLFFESVSQLSVLLLVPFLLHANIPWPTETLGKLEPLLLLGTSLAVHAFLKLLSFFAAMYGRPAPRLGALGWLAASAVCAGVAWAGLAGWLNTLERTRPTSDAEAALQAVAGQHALARPVQEGSQLVFDLSQEPGRGLTLLWANDSEGEEPPVDRIHVAFQLEGGEHRRFAKEIKLAPNGWTSLRIPPQNLSPGAKTCRVVWNAGELPKWQRLGVLMPVLTSNRRMLVAGPAFWEPRAEDTPLNLVLVVVDGLVGHRRSGSPVAAQSLPSLDAFTDISVVFENAYTPAPETPAAVLSLLTGLPPLRHGWFGERRGPPSEGDPTLAQRLQAKGYATAAFTDGEALDDLVVGTGFERGFDLFDDSYAAPAVSVTTGETGGASAAAETRGGVAERVAAWADANADGKFMALVRLAALGTTDGKAPEAAMLKELDRQLAQIIRSFRREGHTCILVTSPYGLKALQRDEAAPAEILTEPILHVPCMFHVPGVEPAVHTEVISLEDMTAAILAALAGATDLGGETPATVGTGEAVSAYGDPLALSVRSGKWRLTWQTELSPSIPGSSPGVGTASLYDAERQRKGSASNQSQREKKSAQHLYEILQAYLQAHLAAEKQ